MSQQPSETGPLEVVAHIAMAMEMLFGMIDEQDRDERAKLATVLLSAVLFGVTERFTEDTAAEMLSAALASVPIARAVMEAEPETKH